MANGEFIKKMNNKYKNKAIIKTLVNSKNLSPYEDKEEFLKELRSLFLPEAIIKDMEGGEKTNGE
jgi:hypothetical protein